MIVFLNKKRMLTIMVCFALTLFIASITGRKETIETVALPIENKVIILDAGHGFPDEG